MSYDQAWSDHQYLWGVYGPAADMTGGYVDQYDLAKLLRSPTKATAKTCLERQISYWFEVGTDGRTHIDKADPRLIEIAERYNCDLGGTPT